MLLELPLEPEVKWRLILLCLILRVEREKFLEIGWGGVGSLRGSLVLAASDILEAALVNLADLIECFALHLFVQTLPDGIPATDKMMWIDLKLWDLGWLNLVDLRDLFLATYEVFYS